MQTSDTPVTAVKGRFYFDIKPESGFNLPAPDAKPRPFRDPAGPFVLEIIAARLRSQGFNLSDPKPGKACQACLRATFPRFKIAMVLGVERRQHGAKFLLATWPTRRLFDKNSLLSSDLADWNHLCDEVEKILRQDLKVDSLQRLTHDEARAQPVPFGQHYANR